MQQQWAFFKTSKRLPNDKSIPITEFYEALEVNTYDVTLLGENCLLKTYSENSIQAAQML